MKRTRSKNGEGFNSRMLLCMYDEMAEEIRLRAAKANMEVSDYMRALLKEHLSNPSTITPEKEETREIKTFEDKTQLEILHMKLEHEMHMSIKHSKEASKLQGKIMQEIKRQTKKGNQE